MENTGKYTSTYFLLISSVIVIWIFFVTGCQNSTKINLPTDGGKSVYFFAGYDFANGNELWMSDGTGSGTKLVKDINLFGDALPYQNLKLTYVNGTTFFVANDGIHGYELWKSTGTEEGTMMVKDINPGDKNTFDPYTSVAGQANEFTSVNGVIFFIANDGTNGYGLWKSDGTEAGTMMVKDINPSRFLPYSVSLNDELVNFHGIIFFAEDNGISGRELWKSDGTEAGTIMVKDINPGPEVSNPYSFTGVGGTLFFIAYDSINGLALWKSDGTETGTVKVKDLNLSTYPSPDNLTDANGTLFFVVNDELHGLELWKSDGTEAGTVLVKDINPAGDSNPSELTNVNGTLFFTANDGTNGTELWKSDGTEEGTIMVKDITLGPETFKLQALTLVNDILYFITSDYTHSDALWRSDGTEEGTVLVKDFNLDGESFFQDNPELMNVNGTLYFLANWIELWKSDGTEAGTVKVMNINVMAKSSFPFSFAEINNILFFKASDGTETGSGLWTTDGTGTGTIIVKNTGIQSEFVHIKDTFYFVSYDEVTGRELWKSDGTEEGTMLVKDINPAGNSNPHELTNVNGILYFTADDGTHGEELWESDGTEAGTVMVKDIHHGFVGSSPYNLLNVNEILFFTANDGVNNRSWWKYDGKDAEMISAGGDFPSVLDSIVKTDAVAISGTIFFIGYDRENGVALWKSDGTSAGTAKVKDIFPSEFNFNWNADIIDVNGTLFFIVYAGAEGIELWKSDGTETGTVKIKDINDSGSSFYTSYYSKEILTSVNGTLFFTADDGVSGVELWKSDGTEGGTIRIKDINPGIQNAFYCLPYPYTSTPDCFSKLTRINDAVFFWANDGTHGFELWKSDGTEAGTIMVKDIYLGSGSSFVSIFGFFFTDLINFNDTLFFSANDGVHGIEIWKSNGTEAGTVVVKDININNQ